MAQALLRDGFLPTSPYTDSLQEIVNSKVYHFTGQLYTDPASTFRMSIIPAASRTPVDFANPAWPALVAKVQAQLQSRISGQGTNLLVSAAEAKGTVEMVANCAKSLAVAYVEVRRGNFRNAAKTLGMGKVPRNVSKNRSAGDNWMEYRYGWRLVVMDAVSLMKTLYDTLTQRPPILRVTAFAAREDHISGSAVGQTWYTGNGVPMVTYDQKQEIGFFYQCHGGYTYQLESVALANAQSFGILNLPLLGWELIPASFVADWFTNVGSVLEGLTAFQGKKLLDGWITKSFESRTEYYFVNLRKATGGVQAVGNLGPKYVGPVIERRFQRSGMAFTPSSIRIDVDLSIPRALDAIQMLRQVMR